MSQQAVKMASKLVAPQMFTFASAVLHRRIPASIKRNRLSHQHNIRGFSITSKAMAPYPSRDEITNIFKHMETGEYAKTFEHISPNVDWTVMGTHPLAGRYTSLKDFSDATFARLSKIMKDPGIRLKVRNVIGGGDQPWSTVELLADAECKNGGASVRMPL